MAGKYKEAHKRANKDVKKMQKVDRRMGNALGGAMDSIMGDLTSTYKGQRRKLTKANERTMVRILALNARHAQANRKTTDNMEGYFKALGGGPNSAMTGGRAGGFLDFVGDKPRTEARANKKLGKAEARYGQDLSDNAQDVMGIIGGQVEGMAASADMLASFTNEQRAAVTAETSAQMHHDITMQKLAEQAAIRAAKLQGKIDRKNMEFQQKVLMDEVGPAGAQVMEAGQFLVGATQSIIDAFNEDPNADPREVGFQTATAMGLQPGDPDQQAIVALAARLAKIHAAGDTPEGVSGDEREEAILSILKTVPDWTEVANHKRVKSYVKSAFGKDAADRDQPNPNVGSETIKKTWSDTQAANRKKANSLGKDTSLEDEVLARKYFIETAQRKFDFLDQSDAEALWNGARTRDLGLGTQGEKAVMDWYKSLAPSLTKWRGGEPWLNTQLETLRDRLGMGD